MERKRYIKPISMVITTNDTESLPIGGSGDYTDSGDDSGGGLAKSNIIFEDDSLTTNYNSLWE
jgi:hypothetical protein